MLHILMAIVVGLVMLSLMPFGKEILEDWGKLKTYGWSFWEVSTAVFIAILSVLWVIFMLALLAIGAFIIYDMF